MKTLKQLFAVTLLVLTLGFPAYAGDIQMLGYTNPPPPPPSSAPASDDTSTPAVATPAPGDMDTATLAAVAIKTILDALALY